MRVAPHLRQALAVIDHFAANPSTLQRFCAAASAFEAAAASSSVSKRSKGLDPCGELQYQIILKNSVSSSLF
jgi:hypothetical protein